MNRRLLVVAFLAAVSAGSVAKAQTLGPDINSDGGPFTRYLAGAGTGQAVRIAIANPGSRAATIRLTFTRSTGDPIHHPLTLGPASRTTIDPRLVPGLEAAGFDTIVESDREVVVDRAISSDGVAFASHGETGAAAPSHTWFVSAGATHSGLNLFYGIHNPDVRPADVSVRYLLPAPRRSLVKTYRVPAGSRYTIWVNAEARSDPALAGLSSTDVSAAISASTKVFVERASYRDRGGDSFADGHESPAATNPATLWMFPEGTTGAIFDMHLALANPGSESARVEAAYRTASGRLVRRQYVVPATGRLSIKVDSEDPQLADATISTTLRSIDGVPFVAERTIRWSIPGGEGREDSHSGAGTTAAASRWAMAEGEAGGAAAIDTVVRLTNTRSTPARARITLLFEDGSSVEKTVGIDPSGDARLSLAREFPSADGRRFAVVADGGPGAALLMEWAMYPAATAAEWVPAINALATPLASSSDDDSAWALESRGMLALTEPDSLSLSRTSAATEQQTAGVGQDAPPSVPASTAPGAATFNLQVATDASPDLTDLARLVSSMTSRWPTSQEKVWALFYWSHILKRQTVPMVLHGFELTDPIRNFADYGFTMCSTVTGINQSLYEAIGLRHQYWDICNHTVSAVEYDGSFHMVDSSMSNLVTRDDGVTLATVQEAAAGSARLVRERSLYASSSGGFLTGSDTNRPLPDIINPTDGSVLGGLAAAFCSSGLKYRDYYYNWDTGHRYVLNLRENETYTRYYKQLGTTSDYWVPSEKVASPNPAQTVEIDSANKFGLRGNGRWTFNPTLTPDGWARAAYSATNTVADGAGGLRPGIGGTPSDVMYKVQAANAITSQTLDAMFSRMDPLAQATISVSVNEGITWTAVGSLPATVGPAVPLNVRLRAEVSGAYEVLVRIQMSADSATPDAIVLTGLTITTVTQVNIKALPALKVGRNEVFVTLGDQSDTMVLWPDLRADLWRKDVHAFTNIASQSISVPRKYTAVAYPAVLTQDAHLTYRLEAPTDITRVVYGGRLHNYKAGSYIDFLHSFDRGATWIRSYRLSDVSKPYDVIHYETVTDIPPGVRSVLFKYLMHNTNGDSTRATGLYSARMEVNHRPPHDTPAPVDVTLRWSEVRADRTTVARSHRQRISAFPVSYVVNVGGADHPVMDSMAVSLEQAGDAAPEGYGDGIDAGGSRYLYTRQTVGTNVARGRPYTFSRTPSGFQASAPASNTTILTDGVVGAPATGGFSYWLGQCWTSGQNVDLRVDLGQFQTTGAFRTHLFGYPSWDALKGQVQDVVEVLTSLDGVTFVSQGTLRTALWRKDVPINHMMPDDEKATAWNFELILPAPVVARYVTYRVTPKRSLCASELQVLDRIDYAPFDLRIAPPPPFAAPATDPPANRVPTVSLAAVGAGPFVAPATVSLTANAQDPDGTVERVEFFAGASSIGIATASPFAITWADVPAGDYLLTAQATDDAGASATSAPIAVTVQPPPSNVPPTVSLTTPTAGARFTAPATISLIADAADADDPLDRVEFFAGTTTLGVATGPPYTVTWQDVPAGDYSLTAVATDARGASTVSAQALVTVLNPGDVTVPGLVGLVQSAAEAALADASLGLGGVTSAQSTTIPAGSVVSQTPAAGASVAPQSLVDVVVSTGPPNVAVPSVAGLLQASATTAIASAGLTVGAVTTAASATVAAGYVIAQTPVAGSSAAPGAAVDLVVSTGAPGSIDVGVPVPWLTQDVGAVGVTGSATYASATETFSVTGGGADIWGTADAFRYVYQPLTGDGQIVARVLSVQSINVWTKAGVMMRADVTSDAVHGTMMVTPGKGINFQRRTLTGGASTGTTGLLVAAPYWVKLTRRGSTFTGFQSADGVTWTTVGSAIIAMPPTIFVGLEVTSHSTTTRATATFDRVAIGPLPAGAGEVAVPAVVGQPQAAATSAITAVGLVVGPVTLAASGAVAAGSVIAQSPAAGVNVSPGSAVALTVSSGAGGGSGTPVSAPWQTVDVGAVGLSGSGTFYAETSSYAVTGAGADIWGTADAFQYVYQALSGDGEIVARVASVQNTNVWVKAGVMIRADLTAGSAHAMMMVTPGKSNNFQRRPVAGGTSTGTTGAAVKAPYWVKLTRVGTSVTAYQSPNGIDWSLVGTSTIALPADVLVGLAVSSHSTTTRATATFEQVTIVRP